MIFPPAGWPLSGRILVGSSGDLNVCRVFYQPFGDLFGTVFLARPWKRSVGTMPYFSSEEERPP